jgi:Zn-dependent peptidase ImmA (M78 family)
MKYANNIVIPYLSEFEIRQQADNFLLQYWADRIPVDIELIAEQKLNLQLTPLPEYRKKHGIDASLTIDGKEIEFDQDVASVRIRFSIAHEIGHFILHYSKFNNNLPKSTKEWIIHIIEFPEVITSKMEFQANEFAGRILVPKKHLLNEIMKLSDKIIKFRDDIEKVRQLTDYDVDYINEYLAKPLSIKFDVSPECMWKRLEKEKINPFKIIDE